MQRSDIFVWYAAIFSLSLLCCAVLFLAFPYGMIFPDTHSYLDVYMHFHLWSSNANDWARTPPYPFLLGVGLAFPQPAMAMIWLNALFFSAGMVSIAWMAVALFRSVYAGVCCALALLFIEILSMHTFAYSLLILTDSVYANLLLIGSMLSTGGWLRHRIAPVWIGFFCLGIAAFMRPVGMSLFPVWIGFALYLWQQHRQGKDAVFTMRRVFLCIALLLLPCALWAARNGVVYGHARVTAFGSRNLLPHVLSLLQDQDQILPDPVRNTAFIQHIRAFGQIFGTDEDVYRWRESSAMPNIFSDLLSQTQTYQQSDGNIPPSHYAQAMFEMDPIATRIALRIIFLHPLGYASLITYQYVRILTSPPNIVGSDMHTWYLLQYPGFLKDDRDLFYPPDGSPSQIYGNTAIANIVTALQRSAVSHAVRVVWTGLLLFFYHLFAIVCVLLLWRCPRSITTRLSLPVHSTLVILLCLLLTAFSNYLLTAMTEGGIERYALPGEIGLHLTVVLCGVMIYQYFSQTIMLRRRS